METTVFRTVCRSQGFKLGNKEQVIRVRSLGKDGDMEERERKGKKRRM